MSSSLINPILMTVLVIVTTGFSMAQPVPQALASLADAPLRVPTAVDTATGQLHCQTVVTANTGTQTIAAGLEFVYPQLRSAEYLNVQVTVLALEAEPRGHKAWFSTAGEDSYWTVPVVLGIAPVVITLVAAPRDPVNDRFVAEFSGHLAVPMNCVPL